MQSTGNYVELVDGYDWKSVELLDINLAFTPGDDSVLVRHSDGTEEWVFRSFVRGNIPWTIDELP